MGLSKDWQPLLSGPQDVQCPKCRKREGKASNVYSLSPTGVVTHLYYCLLCCWCQEIRYVPEKPHQYVTVALIPPDKHGNIRQLKGRKRRG